MQTPRCVEVTEIAPGAPTKSQIAPGTECIDARIHILNLHLKAKGINQQLKVKDEHANSPISNMCIYLPAT